jgi:guanylate cyclase
MGGVLGAILRFVGRIGVRPEDDEDVRLRKALLVGTALMVLPAGVIWGSLYLVFGEPGAALIPWGYSAPSAISLVTFHATRRYRLFANVQFLLILLAPLLLMVVLGGFVPSSGVILWSVLAPLGAIVFDSPRRALSWFALFLGLLVLSGLFAAEIRPSNQLPTAVVLLFFVMNLAGPLIVAFTLLVTFAMGREAALGELRAEQEKSESLLLNILPKRIAEILKGGDRTIAEGFESASILFADVVDFTPLSARLRPHEVVGLLDHLFSHFDTLAEGHGLEKIKTIGDCYMVAAGVPAARPDHAQALARLALEMRDSLESHTELAARKIQVRIGVNSGPVVAGVIGRRRFIYDLWGDAVNVASRMESQGSPGQIQVTRATYELLRDEFILERRGMVEVKGKGEMETWYLVGSRDSQAALPPEPLAAPA